jgi:hypothetical protein
VKVTTYRGNGQVEVEEVEFKPSDEWETRRQKLIAEISGFKDEMEKKHGKRGRKFVENKLKGSF